MKKSLLYLAVVALLLPLAACKKTTHDYLMGSWYLRSYKVKDLKLDTTYVTSYWEDVIYDFRSDGGYRRFVHNGSISNGTWSTPQEGEMFLDGLRYRLTQREKFEFTIEKAQIEVDSMMPEWYFIRKY